MLIDATGGPRSWVKWLTFVVVGGRHDLSLRRLGLHHTYRSDDGPLLERFYIPCLAVAKEYYRAVGYFTGHTLAMAARGLPAFIRRQGRMFLVAAPFLSDEDVEKLRAGYEARQVIDSATLQALDPDSEIVRERLGYLGWLVAVGSLELKLVFKQDDPRGIYHEKVGIFVDDEGDMVAFTGSSNETVGGWYENFESIDVFRSWVPGEDERVRDKLAAFRRLWNNETRGLSVLPFPDALRKKLVSLAPKEMPVVDVEQRLPGTQWGASLPNGVYLRPYQEEAIAAWFKAGKRGILSMATGTGKTLTALAAAFRLLESEQRMVVLIVAPYVHLAEQWAQEVERCNVDRVIKAYGKKGKWAKVLNQLITSVELGVRSSLFVVTTNATFASSTMSHILRKVTVPALIIADEMHYLGAPKQAAALPEHIPYRLGLSATPSRWFDEEGTEKLMEYFGSIVFEFSLGEAIQKGFLTPYMYYPSIVSLNDDEYQDYVDITSKIARVWAAHAEGDGVPAGLEPLLYKRARLIANAEMKIPALIEVLSDKVETTHNIVYCGPGRAGDGSERQLDRVLRILGHQLGMKVRRFTAEEDAETRSQILRSFECGSLQCLVAIRCLDEGVDVPAVRRAFILASSRNPREFVQRRGRVLRRHPSKEVAEIYDFIVVPTPPDEIASLPRELWAIERLLFRRELERITDFAAHALNGPEVMESLLPIRKAYHLLHV